ncbi:efflux transporter outer membrane subunit [Methylibium sp.]|uniref:efflux transporter outer membrane subunit n=1 Tax=Methylibium sp. TaxID=2067992 RepID=UPI003D12DA8F
MKLPSLTRRPRRVSRAVLAPLFAALVLAGCATAPAIDPAALPVAPPAGFKEGDGRWTTAAPAEAQPRGAWWKAFADPALDELVERAGQANNSIQVAAARLAQARALVRAADANRAPQVGLGAGASRGTEAGAGPAATTLLSAGASLSYEVDLVGRLRATSDAASLDARAREALLQSTRLLVQADVAQAYLVLRAVDEERALVRKTVVAYRDTLKLTERRYQAGDVAELDVARVLTQVAATESEALALDRRRAELEHALAVLVGAAASDFQLPMAGWATALPVIPAGVPGTVLARRPDVSAAQSSMLAAQLRVGVAQAAWFPDLTLTATGGHASTELGDLFQWSARAWGVGALLSLPLFDGGRREAGVQNARAELDAALAGYREQVLVAFRDVEDQLSALRLLAEQSEAQSRAVASAARATVLSDSRYRNGLVSQLDLLDAQRSELANRRQALQVRSAQYQATVGLVRALGGGWDIADAQRAPAGVVGAAQARAAGG